eukprot:1144606-Pelagomonas_calceolata.AAC.6
MGVWRVVGHVLDAWTLLLLLPTAMRPAPPPPSSPKKTERVIWGLKLPGFRMLPAQVFCNCQPSSLDSSASVALGCSNIAQAGNTVSGSSTGAAGHNTRVQLGDLESPPAVLMPY